MHCALTGKTWALIASRAVTRVLRLVDRDRLLPTVGSATEALLLVRQSSQCTNRSLEYTRGQWHCISLAQPVKSPRGLDGPARPSPGNSDVTDVTNTCRQTPSARHLDPHGGGPILCVRLDIHLRSTVPRATRSAYGHTG
jgi:hypothetical protein